MRIFGTLLCIFLWVCVSRVLTAGLLDPSVALVVPLVAQTKAMAKT